MVLAGVGLVAGCGGGSSGGAAPTVDGPVPTIDSPAEGATFKAGDTLAFRGSARSAQGGALAAARLVWWVELHHDQHTHPFQPETAGDIGSVTVPVRGETSDNIWYRFHLRVTDDTGRSAEVTRDVHPLKARITLASGPDNLALTLDGQPVRAPFTFTGVVGMQRDLGAADQVSGGRRYRFSGWSDGQPAVHVVSTPAADTTFRATFTDLGVQSNAPPSVTLVAPADGTAGTPLTLTATAADGDGSVARVEFFDGSTSLGVDTSPPFSVQWTPITAGTHNLQAVATDSLGATTASATRAVAIAAGSGDTVPPTATLTAPVPLASGLANTITLTATAEDNVGVVAVEFQIDGMSLGEDTTSPYARALDTNVHAGGQHVLRARARDAAGRFSAWSSATVSFGFSQRLPAGFTRTDPWLSGLDGATAFAQAPDGRLFVCEQGGTLRIVKDGALLPTPFHTFTVDAQGERGLLGVALHPNFASNGFVYVYHTVPGSSSHNRISRLEARGDVSAGVATALVDLPSLGSLIHNGGALHFGPDGKLYAAVGDNSSSANPQSLATPLGKILRFSDDGSIPADNPFFATQAGNARAIWAYGLRNPFNFAFEPGTGRMHINDVGQATWEEINLGAAGANYGWPSSEGFNGLVAGMTAPLFSYPHVAPTPPGSGPGGFLTGAAITGGTFYPADGNFPAGYRRSYYFTDFVRGWISRLDLDNPGDVYSFGSVSGTPVGMLAGRDGALYVLTRTGIARVAAP